MMIKAAFESKEQCVGQVLIYAFLGVGLIFMIFPYIWMVLTSFKIPAEIYHQFWPSRLTLGNYQTVFASGATGAKSPFMRSLFNSLLVSSIGTISVVFFGAITGYALAKLNFKGRKLLEQFILFQMLFPAVLFLIPCFCSC